MAKQHISIGAESSDCGFERFTNAWELSEHGQKRDPEVHLNFEDFSMLLSLLSPSRLEMLKTLRQRGFISVQELSNYLHRDYKKVHIDVSALESAGLLERRDEDGMIHAPWDVIDAHLRLVA